MYELCAIYAFAPMENAISIWTIFIFGFEYCVWGRHTPKTSMKYRPNPHNSTQCIKCREIGIFLCYKNNPPTPKNENTISILLGYSWCSGGCGDGYAHIFPIWVFVRSNIVVCVCEGFHGNHIYQKCSPYKSSFWRNMYSIFVADAKKATN